MNRIKSPLLCRLVIALVVATFATGCAKWHMPRPSLNSLRDPRAVDIDNRLSNEPTTARVRSK